MNDLPDSDDEAGVDPNRIAAATAREVLEYVVRSIVDDPDSVEVDLDEKGSRVGLNVHVGDGDMGRVIGKRGRVANSIRTVVRAAAVRDEVEVDVEFVD
ncbi:MAG: KH domain-containing protein [Acidimicrobiales bacterium]